jgi:hypothetical protein
MNGFKFAFNFNLRRYNWDETHPALVNISSQFTGTSTAHCVASCRVVSRRVASRRAASPLMQLNAPFSRG